MATKLEDRVSHLEKILLYGDGDRLPLAEIVRSLTKTVDSYIAQKDKEEQQAKARAEAEAESKKSELNRLKWIFIPLIITGGITFVGQAIVFYFRFLPILEHIESTVK